MVQDKKDRNKQKQKLKGDQSNKQSEQGERKRGKTMKQSESDKLSGKSES